MRFLWRLLEPKIQALVTERLVIYHEGLVERGQISPPSTGVNPKRYVRIPDAERSSAGCDPGLCPVLPLSEHPRWRFPYGKRRN